MEPGDFFRRDAKTPLQEKFLAAGAICTLQTNFEPILEAAHDVFLPLDPLLDGPDFSVRLWVDPHSSSQPPWPKPYVRGLDHLAFAGFDSESALLVDVRERRVLGRFSTNMGLDRDYWKAVIFPMLMTIVSASLRIVEVHCSCVVKNNRGYLFAGPSGSGKSTLAMALTRAGFAFLSDDRTLCTVQNGRLCAWGLAAPVKLRVEARNWFEELRNQQPTEALDGEPVLRFDPEHQFGLKRAKFCEPDCLIFLERHNAQEFRLSELPPLEAAERIDQELMAEPADLLQHQRNVVDQMTALACWRMQYGGDPETVAAQLQRYFEGIPSKVSQHRQQIPQNGTPIFG